MPKSLVWGGTLVTLLILVALLAPWLAPYDPAEQIDPPAGLNRPPGTELAAVHLADGRWRLADRVRRTPEGLEIERLGRTETFAAAEVLNLAPDGVAVGSAAALGGRWIDVLLMRGVDAIMAFPWLFLVLALAAFLRPGPVAIVGLMGGTAWMTISRLTRAEILGLRNREFILAARAIGQRPLAILWRHLLPNALTPVLVRAALMVGNLILIEASLSFLGMGIQPPTPSWGNLVAEGQSALLQAWWIATFPGAALAITVIAFNLLNDGLRDALDPRK